MKTPFNYDNQLSPVPSTTNITSDTPSI